MPCSAALAARIAVLAAAVAGPLALSPVHAAEPPSPDAATCDRLMAHPEDQDRPASVRGVRHTDEAEVGEALAACTRAAAEPGAHRRMSFQLARALELRERFAEAYATYRRAADAGSASAMTAVAVFLLRGQGVDRDVAAGRALLEQAAALGDAGAMSNLAAAHGLGLGGPADVRAARAWYETAAAAGSDEAMFQLGLMEQDGDTGPKDEAAARVWLESAAALDHPSALYLLGAYCEQGRGGPKDEVRAKRLYLRAARLGDSDAAEALERLRCPFALKDKDGKPGGRICFDGEGGQIQFEPLPGAR